MQLLQTLIWIVVSSYLLATAIRTICQSQRLLSWSGSGRVKQAGLKSDGDERQADDEYSVPAISRRPQPFMFSMIVVALLLILFTCWSLWGLFVGESQNIRWIRHWCGGIFVTMVALISVGSGFVIARAMERASARENAFEALEAIAGRIEAGDHQLVIQKIRALDHRGDPDEDAYDLLDDLPRLVTELQPQSPSEQTAAAESEPNRR